MVIVLKHGTTTEERKRIVERIEGMGFKVKVTKGKTQSILGIVGDTGKLDESAFSCSPVIEKILRIQVPFKQASRDFHHQDTLVRVGNQTIGGGSLTVFAGPCSVESKEQINIIAKAVKASGAQILRGGAFKPRTSPYSFQGMGEKGLMLMKEAAEANDMTVCTEVMSTDEFDLVESYTDVLQIGARNMQNFSLLKKAGASHKPILLKRGMSATIEDFLMSAEYIMAGGNPNVILCERGIRTFETYMRNTLDLAVICAVKSLSHLPIIIDPSHATGRWDMVEPISRAAVAAGADGLMIEVHHEPEKAMSDGPQSLKPHKFHALMENVGRIHAATTGIMTKESVARVDAAIG